MSTADAYSRALSALSRVAIFIVASIRRARSNMATLFPSEFARLARSLILSSRFSALRGGAATLSSALIMPGWPARGTLSCDIRDMCSSVLDTWVTVGSADAVDLRPPPPSHRSSNLRSRGTSAAPTSW